MNPLIAQLLPLATQFVVPLMEKLIGGKKSPTDTATGDQKANSAITILQQAVATLQSTGALAAGPPSTDDLKAIVDLAVTILKPLGLSTLGQGGTLSATPQLVAGSTVPIVLSGTLQIGATK